MGDQVLHIINIGGTKHLNTFMHGMATLRIFRVIRLMRYMESMHSLNAMYVALTKSLETFFCAMVVLLIIVFTFSVAITMIITNVRLNSKTSVPEDDERLNVLFGSVTATMWHLWMVITHGMHWHNLVEEFRDDVSVSACSARLVIVCFATFMAFAIENVVIGFFTDSVVEATVNYRRRHVTDTLRAHFKLSDTDASGDISWEEFKQKLSNPGISDVLKSANVGEEDALELFRLVDKDSTGTVTEEELIYGFHHLAGTSKAVDLAALTAFCEAQFVSIHNRLDSVAGE